MIVQHNITAMNANRMLGLTTGFFAKSTEKLSSGYRINRAADDAAGLSISEKMRKQIRGLNQASTNAEDGISAVQTAEGALTEVHSMLQRMNELAVQAANGTMSSEDRQSVQDEIDSLVTEIDRVSETTKFNEIYLLKGDGEKDAKEIVTTPMTATFTDLVGGEATVKQIDDSVAFEDKTGGKKWYAKDGTTVLSADEIIGKLTTDKDGNVILKAGEELYSVAATEYDAADTNTEYGTQTQNSKITITDIRKFFGASATKVYAGATDAAEVKEEELSLYFNDDGTSKSPLYAKKSDGTFAEIGAEQIDRYVTVTAGTSEEKDIKVLEPLTFRLHVGSESANANKITVNIDSMSAKGIGIDGLSGKGVMTEESSTDAITTIGDAIKKVSAQRSALGAIQNRLEHTIANLDNVVENTTAAESRIRDTDMAEEMVTYSKNSILQQAGQSMLAQANQANQGVLSLLQ